VQRPQKVHNQHYDYLDSLESQVFVLLLEQNLSFCMFKRKSAIPKPYSAEKAGLPCLCEYQITNNSSPTG